MVKYAETILKSRKPDRCIGSGVQHCRITRSRLLGTDARPRHFIIIRGAYPEGSCTCYARRRGSPPGTTASYRDRARGDFAFKPTIIPTLYTRLIQVRIFFSFFSTTWDICRVFFYKLLLLFKGMTRTVSVASSDAIIIDFKIHSYTAYGDKNY